MRDQRRRALKSGIVLVISALCVSSCGISSQRQSGTPRADPLAIDIVRVKAGEFEFGSSTAQRTLAYQLDETAYGHSVTREQQWYERELSLTKAWLPEYFIMRTPVTNRQYAQFVAQTGHRSPGVDKSTWTQYGLVHPFAATQRFAWVNEQPIAGREEHPVVLVDHADARAFARWLSNRTDKSWRLPTEREWEKAARGTDGRLFPWGNEFDGQVLNSHDAGPFDTVAVGSYSGGASPFGVLDMAGQVYEWTADTSDGRAWVKGGSWDDKGCGVCRSAARHTRPIGIKHILIGFRLVHNSI